MSNEHHDVEKLDDTPHNISHPDNKLELSGFEKNSLNNIDIRLGGNEESPYNPSGAIAVSSSDNTKQTSHSNDNDNNGAPQQVEVVSTQENKKTDELNSSSEEIIKNTMDEPVLVTLQRDFLNIYTKGKFVINPGSKVDKGNQLGGAQWDGWGPLLFILILGSIMTLIGKQSQFAGVFYVFWIGSFAIYFNGKMINEKWFFCSIASLLGYSLFPYVFSSFLIMMFKYKVFQIILGIISFCWAMYTTYKLIQNKVIIGKMFLTIYPIGLFFIFFTIDGIQI